MSEWRSIWQESLLANRKMLQDDNHSEQAFSEVLSKYKNDGMVYYELGEAYELSGNYSLAINNYEKAKRLFPVPHWKYVASTSLQRIKDTIQDHHTDLQQPVDIKWYYFHKFHALVYLPETYARYNSISAIAKIDSDPDLSISAFRKSLEVSLKELLNPNEESNDRLEILIKRYIELYGDSKHLKSRMNTLRILGNEATHSLNSSFTEEDWKTCLREYFQVMKQINDDLKLQNYYI